MIERTIVLPITDNAGDALNREILAIQREILAIAGGYSQVFQEGVWIDEEEVYKDRSIRLVTTVTPEQDKRIVARIAEWCAALRQVCIYTHKTRVTADFVYPVAQETASNEVA